MERKDKDLGFLLNYENVAWYENGKVKILDRRVYPRIVTRVECTTYKDVAQAISDMVTQSAGPYTAAGMGMALAADEIKNATFEKQKEFLAVAAFDIAFARPTTSNRMGIITKSCFDVGIAAMEKGESAAEAIFNSTVEALNRRYTTMEKVGQHLAQMFPNNGAVLTQCFGETIVGMMLRAAKESNKDIKIYCAETRPYLQGARLTASVCQQMGFDTTVISDNMVAYTMQNCGINLFTSAADTIAQDGHIANKVGTFQMAILADFFNIPYFVTGIPDRDKFSKSDIVIEQRDPINTLSCHGIKHTLEGVKGIYPSFDITPPRLISGVVTDKGVFSPYDLASYFKTEVKKFY